VVGMEDEGIRNEEGGVGLGGVFQSRFAANLDPHKHFFFKVF
jgi:hypothetical protein